MRTSGRAVDLRLAVRSPPLISVTDVLRSGRFYQDQPVPQEA